MKTILLFIGASFFLGSCGESEAANPEELSTDEMKSIVEAEVIQFEEPELELIASFESNEPKTIDPIYGGCIIPKSELRGDSLPPLPKISDGPVPPNRDEPVFDIPEVDAQYPGGMIEFKKFIQENTRYPESEVSVQGTVYVSMVVAVNGKIRNVEVIRGISEELDAEALRVVRSMPNWIPAEDKGKIVAAKVRLPIRFSLN